MADPVATAATLATTTAATVQQVVQPPEMIVSPGTAGVLGTLVMATVSGVLYLRRRMSRDGVQVVQDRTEAAMLKTSLIERAQAIADAREAWVKANADARLIGQLTAENEYLKRELEEARGTIQQIRVGVIAVGRNVDQFQKTVEQAQRNVRSMSQPMPLEPLPLPGHPPER